MKMKHDIYKQNSLKNWWNCSLDSSLLSYLDLFGLGWEIQCCKRHVDLCFYHCKIQDQRFSLPSFWIPWTVLSEQLKRYTVVEMLHPLMHTWWHWHFTLLDKTRSSLSGRIKPLHWLKHLTTIIYKELLDRK